MGTISSNIGLLSGINTTDLVNAITARSSQSIQRLQVQSQTLGVKSQGLDLLETTITAISVSVTQLNKANTFNSFSLSNSGSEQFTAATNSNALDATYNFQTIRTASTDALRSKGFANADVQTLGTGTITISQGGSLQQETLLDTFNGGTGVQKGSIRITDRSGSSADIDLTNVFDVDEVLNSINSNNNIDITAVVQDGKLILTDTTGSTTSNLIVAELNGGQTAANLGIIGSIANTTLTGSDVYEITSDFTLDFINDGNGLARQPGADDLRISTSDGNDIDIDFDTASTIGDIVNLINNDTDNAGKVTASFSNEKFTLVDNTSGGGTLQAANINGSSVVRQLGLETTAIGTTLTGLSVGAGINTVLLRNLRGGRGIDVQGQISLTDRAGASATIDLSGAESLDDIIAAINSASPSLQAALDTKGTGITITDTSGSTAGNFIIADVTTSTVAADLGITINAASDSIDSGSLGLRYVNEATSLSNYAPDGTSVDNGSIKITDSAGNEAIVSISTSTLTVGDVITRINAATGIQVTAQLNDTGDGFVLIDEAAGAGTLSVTESGGSTAADLRLLGNGAIASDGKLHIESQLVTTITVDATDTLSSIATKINDAGGLATASTFDDGSAFNSARLSITSKTSGRAGRLIIDDGGLGLGLVTTAQGNDALLRVGSSVASGFVVSSSNNTFTNIAQGVDITAVAAGSSIKQVSLKRDTGSIKSLLAGFVSSYNGYITATRDLSRFNSETSERGILQGEGSVLRIESRLASLINRNYLASTERVSSLGDLGIRTTSNGKILLDDSVLDKVLSEDPTAVSNFFLDSTNGFAQRADDTLKSFTDPFTGLFKTEGDAIQSTVDSFTSRIGQLNVLLDSRKARLFRQFAQMESALGQLQSQQSALGALSNISFLSPNSRS